MFFISFLNLFCTQSLIKYRDINIAKVAPNVLAKDTTIVPLIIPKKAPPAKVNIFKVLEFFLIILVV